LQDEIQNKIKNMEFEYDLTLSFAGEDREYVEQVATILKENGARVFYDKFEEVDLWGKDLGTHFDFVYRKSARYCIPFISKFYKEKIWTNHEIKTAISRSITSNEEYILPARFDDTDIDGIRPTLGFVDLRKYKPKDFAHLVLKKLNSEHKVPIVEAAQKDEGKVELSVGTIYATGVGMTGVAISVKITNTNKDYRYFEEPSIYVESEDKFFSIFMNDRIDKVQFPVKLEFGQSIRERYYLRPVALKNLKDFPKGSKLNASVSTSLGEKYKANSLDLSHVIAMLSACTEE
jgi:hypothetical protein